MSKDDYLDSAGKVEQQIGVLEKNIDTIYINLENIQLELDGILESLEESDLRKIDVSQLPDEFLDNVVKEMFHKTDYSFFYQMMDYDEILSIDKWVSNIFEKHELELLFNHMKDFFDITDDELENKMHRKRFVLEIGRTSLHILKHMTERDIGLLQIKLRREHFKSEDIEPIQVFNEILKEKPDHLPTYIGKGNALTRLGRYSEALECIEIALEMDYDDEDESHPGQSLYETREDLLRKLGKKPTPTQKGVWKPRNMEHDQFPQPEELESRVSSPPPAQSESKSQKLIVIQFEIIQELESKLRELLKKVFSDKQDWWEKYVPIEVRDKLEYRNRKDPNFSGLRKDQSLELIDSLMFKEVQIIITGTAFEKARYDNYEFFKNIFPNYHYVNGRLIEASFLRNSICHMNKLNEKQHKQLLHIKEELIDHINEYLGV